MMSKRVRHAATVLAAAGAVTAGLLGSASASTSAPSDLGPRLSAGQTLRAGQALTSPGGQYQLTVADEDGTPVPQVHSRTCGWLVDQNMLEAAVPAESGELRMGDDGNLTLVQDGQVTWSSNTSGNPGAFTVMQADGNLVVYTAAGRPVFNTGRELACQHMDAGQESWWWTDTQQSGSQVMRAGDSIVSENGRFQLAMQGDGNLVLSDRGAPIWHTSSYGNPGARLVMQGDGNLVVYSAQNRPLWATMTTWRAGADQEHWLSLQDDGNLVLYWTSLDADDYAPRWWTGTSR